MEKAPEVIRHYPTTDNYMLTRVGTILNAFSADLADFTAFAASFDNLFKTQWQADYDAAMAVLDDETIVDQQKALTVALETAMTAARNKWSELSFFVKRAFPDSKARQDEFGMNDYRNARETAMGLTRFMNKAHLTAEKYKTNLIAKDYSQPKIDEIAALGLAVASADSAQEDFKSERRNLTEDRIKILNKPYDTMLIVNEAAQIIYANSLSKRKTYTFQPTGGDPIDGPGDYTGSVATDQRKEVAHINYRTDRILTFLNTGDAVLQFYLTGDALEPGDAVIVTLVAGATQSHTMGELSDTSNHIIVHNASGGDCTYKVTVGE